jgi:putative transposase
MSAQRFSAGKHIQWRGETFEIKRLLPDHQINLENIITGAAIVASIVDLVKDLYDGLLSFVLEGKRVASATEVRPLNLSDYPEHLVDVARFRLQVINPLLDLESRTRQDVIDRVREINEPNAATGQAVVARTVSVASVYRWLAGYEKSGRDVRSLIPSIDRRGGKGNWRVEPEIEAIIGSTIQDKYFAREKRTVDDILEEVAARLEEENRVRPTAEKLSCPSRTTIDRRIEALDMRAVFTARHGKRAAKRQFRQFGKGPQAEMPLERVEIDHTRIDLIVIDDKDNLPLGRATLTDCMDVATRYPLGYYLSFDPPSYYSVMECLYHSIRPKENVKEKYGTEHDWIAYGIPATLVTDNGKEFIGRSLEDACLSLNIVLEQMPIKQPHYKGKIERLFKTIGTVLQGIPGTTYSNVQQRGDYDSVGQACVYLDEVEALLNIFFVDIYAERLHKGIEGVPARRWEQAIRNGLLPRVPASADELLILLGQVDWRTIQHYGIDFQSIRYNCPELAFLRNRLQGEKAKIKFHPGDLSRLHVYDPFNERYIPVPAEDSEGYTVGLSLWKHRVIRRFALSERDKVDLAALGRAKRKIQDIVDRARSRKRTGTRSSIARWDSSGQAASLADKEPTTDTPAADDSQTGTQLPDGSMPHPNLDHPSPPHDENALPTEPGGDDGWGITYDLPRSRSDAKTEPMEVSGNGGE